MAIPYHITNIKWTIINLDLISKISIFKLIVPFTYFTHIMIKYQDFWTKIHITNITGLKICPIFHLQIRTILFLKEQQREDIYYLGIDSKFLDLTLHVKYPHKNKIINWTSPKWKPFALQNIHEEDDMTRYRPGETTQKTSTI